MKRILTILMALMIIMAIDVPSWGQALQTLTEASIVFSEAGLTDGQDMNEQILAIDENVSVAFRTAAGNTAPQFHGSSNSIWAYGGNRIEINSPCPITNVVFTTGADDGDNVIGSDVGNMSSLTWTGSAYSVSFYFSNYSEGGDPDAHRSIAAIEVDYLVSENVPAPTFTPEPGSYFESVVVSIDCNSQNNNVTIYYTDDGSIPNSNSMIFSTTPSPAAPQPIQITQTTTLKAIAVMEDATGMPIDSSSIATATYVIPEDLNEVSISEAKSYPAGEFAMVYGTVTLIQGQQLFIQDYSGGIRLNCTVEPDTSLFLGADVQVIGKVTEGLCMTELSEIDPYNSSQFSVLWDEPLPEEVHTISEIVSDFENGDNALQASRVMIKGARVESINFFAYTTISQDNETIDIFQLPMIEGLQVGDSISVAAIVSCYNSLELLVAKAEDVRPYTAPRLKTFSLLADIEDFDPNASYLLVCPSASTAAMRYDDSGFLATQVSIEEGSDYPYITTFTDEDDYPCTFTFEPDPATGYLFMKWDDLYIINDGEEFVYLSDEPSSYWTISSEDGGCMVLTAPTPRFFGGYGGDGWFYYTQPYDSLYSVDYPFTVLYKEGTPAPQQVSTPTFDPVSGNYITPQQVSIFCATDDATIYYTLDGSEPNENSLVYVDPIEVSQQNTNTIIKAIAMKDGWTASEVATSEYFILAPISIAEAKTLQPGAKVLVEGVVTYFDDYTIYIQDETAGIVINLDQQFPGIAIGDLFQVYATREYVGGMYALIDIDKYNIVSHNNELPLEVRTIAECLEGADDELQSTRVQIVDAILGSLNTGGITMLYQDTDSIGIFKIPAVGPEYYYSFVNVIGVLSYGDAAQLLVAFDSDIERLESSMNVSPENLEDFSYEQGEGPSEPQSIMITYEYVPYDVYLSTSETFEMSLSEDGPYSPSLELPKSDGGLSEYIVYVRMVAALPMDTYQSSLSISYGYDEIIIPLVGNVEILNTVEDPTFSPAGGTYMNGQMVSITCATPDATIYYTTDGSRVTIKSPVYSEPIEVDSSMVISAMAVRENWWNSNVVTAEYEILTPMSIAEAKSLQPGSLAMVEGVVTFIDGILVFIQDESAGIALNLTEAYSNLAVGDLVQVYGIRNNSQGLIKLVGINPTESNKFNIVSSDNDLPLEVRTIEECLEGASYDLQSTRVMIEEAVIGTINTNGNTSLTQGNNTINIYKVPALDNVESNSYVNIIAVIGNNINNTPQLHVAFASDVEPIESSLTIEPESLSGFTYEQGEGPSDPQVFSVSCEYIAGNVVLTAGEFFEMSLTEDGQYSSTLSLPTVDGMLSATTVYVRMMADLEENDYESSITVPLNGDEISIGLSGTVTWTQVVATPMFSPAGGIYMNAPMVSMICSTPGATIYYTLDGSEPTENSILYSDPIEVNSSCVIKAIAVLTGWKNSEVKTDSYEILTPMSIAEAKALQLNEFAMVEGIVTFIDDRNVYVQDETAGIVLYLNKASSNLAIGDQVQAYGKRATANGLIELTGINPADYTRFNIVSNDNELPLAVMTIEECLEGAADELQSTRVLIENAVIGVIHPNGNTSLTQGESSMNIYKIPELEGIEANDHVNVIAVIGFYNNPRLRVAFATDVEIAVPNLTVSPLSLQGFTYEQGEGPSEPQTLTLSGQSLAENILLSIDQYFEMSLTADGQYASTLSLPTENGTLAGTTIYVRMMGDLTMNDYESVITMTNGDEVITVNLSGNVTISNTVETPVFTPAGGNFLHAQTVSILCPTDGATIHYTLDGSEPTESSTVYTEPIEISSSALIRAIATKPNWMDSEEASDYYEILVPMTIAEAKELEMGEHVTIEGIVTFIDGNNVTIQDETAGIVLNLGDASVNTAIGSKVLVYGQTANVNGLFELFVMDADDDNQFDIVSTDNELPLEVQSIENCLAGADYELQSTRVMIEEAIIGTINPDGYTTLTQGGNTINIYHVPALDNVEPNSYVDVIAVIGYDNEAQLRVYAASDVTMLAPSLTVNPQSLELFSYEQGEGPSETQTLLVSTYYVAGDVVLTAGEYFEISLTEDGPYSSMLSLPTEEGRLEEVPVYVRMMADLMMNEYESTLILAYGTEEMTLALNGNVTISNTVEAPAFTPATGTYMNTQLVSILCPTEGATIYYTTDGSEPNENSTVYTEPIEVSSSMVIKAIATKLNWMNSEVVTAAYEIIQTMTIAEAKALEINEYATVEGVVTFIDGKNVYIQDATAGINLYLNSNASNVAIGDMVRAYGKRATFNGLIELSGINPNDDSQFSIVSNDNPLPLVVKTIEECLAGGAYELQSTRVMIQNAVIGTINTNGNTTLTQGDNTINIYRIPALEDVEANSFVNVIAVIGYYNAPQLRVAFASDVEVLEPNLTVTPLSLQGFTYEQSQGPSATQTLTVSGQHLAENVLLTADQYFEMSLSANGVYHSTLDLTTEDGTLNATTVYVRMMAGLVMGNYESSITVANGDEEILVNLSGIVTISNTVEAPSFNPAGGSYLSAQLVSILCPTEGAIIHYTMDGSNPTESSPVYTEPIEVNSTCVIKAIATKANWMSSSVVTASYEIYNTMTIAEARQLANNQYATVQGVVTLVDGRNVYIQDNTAGIVLYLNNNTVPSDLSIGDMVRSHGKKSVYNGLVELTGIKGNNTNEFTILSEDNTLPLNNLTINQIQADYNADNLLQATRIKINNAIIRSINYNGNSLITQGDAQINIYKMPYVEGLEVGDNVNVTGVIGCFNAPQILVAQSTDITYEHRPTIVASPNSMPTFDYVVGEGPSQVQTLMISGTHLTGYIQITASENFEISDTDGEYFLPTSSMLLAPVGNELAPTPVYVRLKAGLPLGMYNESLVLSSEGADDVYVSCTGNVHEEGDQNGWRKIIDLSEIVEGSRIIIAARYDNENTNSYYAMTASTSGKPTGVLFTSEMSGADEVLPATITNEAGTYAWTIGRLGELYTFTNEAGSVLGYSSSTNFATGGDNIGWSIVSGTSIDTGVMVSNYAAFNIINGNVTNRAAALNSNHNFGPYSTSNMTNGNGANYNFYLDIFISSSSATPTVSAPVFAPVAGTYYEEIDVTIECATEDATIYYSDSSEDGPWTVYTTPIHLASSTTLWAYAEKEDYNTSAVVSAEYIINAGMVILFDQDWEEDWKGWTEVSVIGEPQWGINSHSGNHYAYANAYNQGQTEDWLISPAFDLDAHPDAILNFRTARNYSGPDIEVFFSNDYDGEHPAEATWQPIVCELSQGNGWNWVETGDISMSAFSGSNCYIAYRYTSTEDLAAGWEVDDILLYCNGTSENPYLNATPNALSGFTHLEGQGPSASQSFVLTGGNLPPVPGSDEGAVLVYFANNFDFEISLDDQEYSSSLYIPVVGTLDPTTIYVRLNGTEIGHYETDLTIEGSGDVSITVALSGDVLSADQPELDAFMPVYIQGNNGSNNNRVPIAIAVYLANLEPNTTYRYVNQFVDDNDGPETPGAGNVIYANPNGFYRTTSPSLATEGDYGEFTTDENGDAFAWFINEPTANTRFTPGNHVYLRIRLNDGQRGTDVAHILTTEDFATVLNFGTGNSDTEGTAFYASSEEDPMTFVMMFSDDYDFRPTYSTPVETTGIDYASINQYADFYKEQVAGKDGYFGGIIPNNNEKGINIIWVLDMESYVIGEYYTENGDGIWGEVTTANLTGGIENPVFLDLISLSVEEGEALNVKVWNREHEIIVENAESQGMKMMVYNLLGQPVMTRDIAAQSNVRIPHNLSYGLYVITLENAQGKMSAKIVVK